MLGVGARDSSQDVLAVSVDLTCRLLEHGPALVPCVAQLVINVAPLYTSPIVIAILLLLLLEVELTIVTVADADRATNGGWLGDLLGQLGRLRLRGAMARVHSHVHIAHARAYLLLLLLSLHLVLVGLFSRNNHRVGGRDRRH